MSVRLALAGMVGIFSAYLGVSGGYAPVVVGAGATWPAEWGAAPKESEMLLSPSLRRKASGADDESDIHAQLSTAANPAESLDELAAESFSCLRDSRRIIDVAELVTGQTTLPDGTPVPDEELWFGSSNFYRLSSGDGIDARGVTIVTPTMGWSKPYRKWYPFHVRAGLDSICIAGGHHINTLPLSIGFHDSKGNQPGSVASNSAAIAFASTGTTVSGAYLRGQHDSIRPRSGKDTDGSDWRIEHTWVEYNRDDCVETDTSRGSGTIYDSLFDGCSSGISVRARRASDRIGDTFTLEKVLMRLEPMPFPRRWWDRYEQDLIYTRPYDRPVEDSGRYSAVGVPFGHGRLFKLNRDPDKNPRFVLKNSIFLFQQLYDAGFTSLPRDELVAGCEDVTVVWAGAASLDAFKARFDIPAACGGQLTITDDLSVWTSAVADWHGRHPQVGEPFKPEVMGDIRIPRWDRQPWAEHSIGEN